MMHDAINYSSFVVFLEQGALLSLNSEPRTIARNSGVLYGSVQALSGLCGNTFTYFQFKEDNEISPEDRDVFIAVLLTITCVGIAINLLLLPMPWAKASAQKIESPVPFKISLYDSSILSRRQ